MSYEVWGDDDEDDYGADRLLEAGWWPSEQAKDVVDAIKALRSEPIYENGDKASGVSVKFLMRITLLEYAAELRNSDDPLVREAMAVFSEAEQPRFQQTFCSQCGREFGPGNHGFSHCEDHS